MEIKILYGDNIELLKSFPDNHFDSVVTDCPYGLGKEPNALKLLQDWIDHGYHEIKGKGFMGKSWDAFVPQPLFWKEVFRVLKPGGYVLAFFGTRTYDWGVMAIRLAGFEIRDTISWMYGSGFPKSLAIDKQFDKIAGAERKVVGKGKAGKGFNKVKGFGVNTTQSNQFTSEWDNTENATDEAKQWAGWGTALKPAQELICMARKPLCGNVAENVLKYSTGGINLDGCRIEFESEDDLQSATYGTGTNIIGGNYVGSKLTDGRKNIEANSLGRFPANVIFDPFMADVLDEQTGILQSGSRSLNNKLGTDENGFVKNTVYGKFKPQSINIEANKGGASRFFYCAKASQEERNLGCEEIEQKLGGFKNDSGRGISGNPELTYSERFMGNNHPTVKPISLIRYLQRLVTPKGGICLDPFAGSGTSGCAAYFEDIGEMVLMEMEETYIPLIEARTKYWSNERNRVNYLDEIKKQKIEIVENQFSLF